MCNFNETIDAKSFLRIESIGLGLETQNHQESVLYDVSLAGCEPSYIVRRHIPILLYETVKETVRRVHPV